MNEAQTMQRKIALAKSGGVCEVCGRLLGEHAQGAHRIADTLSNRRKFGSFVIDSPLNISMVCSLRCNDSCNIGNSPRKCLELIKKIVEKSLDNNSKELVCNTIPIIKDNVCTSFLEKEDSNTPTISCVFHSKE